MLYSLGSCLLANRYLVVLCSGTVQSVIRFPHYRQVTKGAPVIKPRGVEWRLHNPISPRTPPPRCILPPGGIHSAPYPHFLLSESLKQGSRRHAAGRTSECLHLCTPDIAQCFFVQEKVEEMYKHYQTLSLIHTLDKNLQLRVLLTVH